MTIKSFGVGIYDSIILGAWIDCRWHQKSTNQLKTHTNTQINEINFTSMLSIIFWWIVNAHCKSEYGIKIKFYSLFYVLVCLYSDWTIKCTNERVINQWQVKKANGAIKPSFSIVWFLCFHLFIYLTIYLYFKIEINKQLFLGFICVRCLLFNGVNNVKLSTQMK